VNGEVIFSSEGADWFVDEFQWNVYIYSAAAFWGSDWAYSDCDRRLSAHGYGDPLTYHWWGYSGAMASGASGHLGLNTGGTGNQYQWWPRVKGPKFIWYEGHKLSGTYVFFVMELHFPGQGAKPPYKWTGYVGGIYQRVYLPTNEWD
jgi:hypothetical protein